MQVKLRKYQIFAQRQVTDRAVCNIALEGKQVGKKQRWTINLAFLDQGSDPPGLGVVAEDPGLVLVTLPCRDLKHIQHLLETEKAVEAAWDAEGGQLLWFRVNGPWGKVGR